MSENFRKQFVLPLFLPNKQTKKLPNSALASGQKNKNKGTLFKLIMAYLIE